MRSTYNSPNPTTIIHTGTCPRTGRAFVRRYTIAGEERGYVYCDDTPDGSRPGTLGKQPRSGIDAWWTTAADLKSLIKREWRKECAFWK